MILVFLFSLLVDVPPSAIRILLRRHFSYDRDIDSPATNLDIVQIPLTLSPVTDRRLDVMS